MKVLTYMLMIILGLGGFKANKTYAQIAYQNNNKPTKIYAVDPAKKTIKNVVKEKVDYSEWKELLQRHTTSVGGVNYEGFKNDIEKFNKFLRILSNTKINGTWSKKDRISFWINVYNAYTVKLIVDNYPVNSIKEIEGPWRKEFFSINGDSMSLGEVEHQILRKFGDARIHFAINCASASCPRLIQIPYTSENLERLLERQTKEFINDPFYNTITNYTVNVSKLFDWYKKDFKASHGTVTNFINKYSKTPIGSQKDKGYKSYDWSINSKHKTF